MSIENEIKKNNQFTDDINQSMRLADEIFNDLNKTNENIENNSAKEALDIVNSDVNDCVLDITTNDIKRAETIRGMFSEVDKVFSSDLIKTSQDVMDVPFSVLTEIVSGKGEAEACATITYFAAQKLALSGITTEEQLSSFKKSPEHRKMISDVNDVVVSAGIFDGWKEKADDAKDYFVDKAGEAKDAMVDFAYGVKDKAVEVYSDTKEKAVEIKDTVVDNASNIKDSSLEKMEELKADAIKNFNEAKDSFEEFTIEFSEKMIDISVNTVYLGGRFGLGILSQGEKAVDFVNAAIYEAMGVEGKAEELLQNDFTGYLREELNDIFDPSDRMIDIGDSVEKFGAGATVFSLAILALSKSPVIAAAMGTGIIAAPEALGAGIGIASIFSLGLIEGGDSLYNNFSKTGEVDIKELASASLKSLLTVSSYFAIAPINSNIIKYGSKFIARGLANSPLAMTFSEKVMGDIVGVLTCSAIAGADTGLFELSDTIGEIADVCLGLNDNYDIVQNLKDSFINVGASCLIGGIGYYGVEKLRATSFFQKLTKTQFTPDYFHNVYSKELARSEYIKELKVLNGDIAVENWSKVDLNDFVLRTPEEVEKLRGVFKLDRLKLIEEWELKTGKKWPRYTEDVINPKTGKVVRHAGDRYDAHHIKPISMGGENVAENLTPLDITSHQNIHSADSSYSRMRALLESGQTIVQPNGTNMTYISALVRGDGND